MRDSVIIIAFFGIGVAVGRLFDLPDFLLSADTTRYALWALMFCVGITIGGNRSILTAFRSQGILSFLLPLATVLGSWGGSAAVGALYDKMPVMDAVAVGGGMGYYSRSSIIITEAKGAELGTVALLSNIMRELTALLFAPLIMTVFGKLAPISAGGATTADTTLPIITAVSGSNFAIISIIHGIIIDLTVTFTIPVISAL